MSLHGHLLDVANLSDEFRETEYDNSVKSYLACEEGKVCLPIFP